MINLNSHNGADKILLDIAEQLKSEVETPLIGAEFGIAYGGSIEEIGRKWLGKGEIHGFDTFEGHPDYMIKGDKNYPEELHSFPARCMDDWYREDKYGKDKLSLEYQQSELDRQHLFNVKLHKGLITPETDVSMLSYLNYCLIDLDIPKCMYECYQLIKDKMIKGSYLCLHDVMPKNHIVGLWEWYQQILQNDGYEFYYEDNGTHLAVLKKL